MRVTIVKDDGVVGVDGVFRKVDLSSLHPLVRAVQWNGSNGHVEFQDANPANLELTSFADYQIYIEMWTAAAPPPPPITPAPDPRTFMQCSRFQGKAALLHAGLLTQVEAYFADPATPALDKLAWQDTGTWNRLSPFLVSVGVKFNLTPEQLDSLFTYAMGVQV